MYVLPLGLHKCRDCDGHPAFPEYAHGTRIRSTIREASK